MQEKELIKLCKIIIRKFSGSGSLIIRSRLGKELFKYCRGTILSGPKKGYRDYPIIEAPLGKIISSPSFLVSKDAIFSEFL